MSVCHVIIFNMFTSITCIITISSFWACFHACVIILSRVPCGISFSSCIRFLVEHRSPHVSGPLWYVAHFLSQVPCGTSLPSCLRSLVEYRSHHISPERHICLLVPLLLTPTYTRCMQCHLYLNPGRALPRLPWTDFFMLSTIKVKCTFACFRYTGFMVQAPYLCRPITTSMCYGQQHANRLYFPIPCRHAKFMLGRPISTGQFIKSASTG